MNDERLKKMRNFGQDYLDQLLKESVTFTLLKKDFT